VIEINEIGYVYRDWSEYALLTAGSCNVNVNCSEGNNYRNAQRGVVRIYVVSTSGAGWCSGTLINNTAQDKKPYILTAAHCIEPMTTANSNRFNQFIFYFKYEGSSCSSTSASQSSTLTGCSLKAYDPSYWSSTTKSDFCLLLLNNTIPQSYNPYWCGWDRNTTPASNGVCIHHPDSDIKKISTFNTTAEQNQSGYGGVGSGTTHWKITWRQTENGFGVTEGGSSGSAIFNSSEQIIGTLSGGESSCSNKTWDLFGKFSYHWQSNGTPDSLRLKPWLDPTNSGVTTLGGRDFLAGLDYLTGSQNNISISLQPNPAKDIFNIYIEENIPQQGIIDIINSQGKTIETLTVNPNQKSISISCKNYPAGLYMVQFISADRIATKKLILL